MLSCKKIPTWFNFNVNKSDTLWQASTFLECDPEYIWDEEEKKDENGKKVAYQRLRNATCADSGEWEPMIIKCEGT